MTWALVTGATAGIGRSFAEHLAGRGHDLVLVARDRHRLEGVAGTLRERHGVRVEVLAADLADRDALDRVARRVAAASDPIDVLVNNAGFSAHQRFVGADLGDEEAVLDVMVRAVLVLTHAAVAPMVERGRGRIINVSSIAGRIPAGTYNASKAWVTGFTQGVAGELAGTGVVATVSCPGFTRTEFHRRAGIDASRVPRIAWQHPDTVVRAALRDNDAGRAVSIPGALNKAAWFSLGLTPDPVLRRMASVLASGAGVRPAALHRRGSGR